MQAAGAVMVGKASTHEIGTGTTGLNVAAGTALCACCMRPAAALYLHTLPVVWRNGCKHKVSAGKAWLQRSDRFMTFRLHGRHATEPAQPGASHRRLVLRVCCAGRRRHLPLRNRCARENAHQRIVS